MFQCLISLSVKEYKGAMNELWKSNMEAIHVRFLVYSMTLFQVRKPYGHSSEMNRDRSLVAVGFSARQRREFFTSSLCPGGLSVVPSFRQGKVDISSADVNSTINNDKMNDKSLSRTPTHGVLQLRQTVWSLSHQNLW